MPNPSAPIEYSSFPGLTLTLDLYPLGSETAAASGIVLTEATNRHGLYTGADTHGLSGWYQVFVHVGGNTIPDGFIYMTVDTTIHRVIPVMGGDATAANQIEILAELATIQSGGTVQIELTAPVTSGGDVQIVIGDDYLDADGRALEWSSGGSWPDLTGSSIELTATNPLAHSKIVLETAGSPTIPSGSSQKVTVELTADETDELRPGTMNYSVRATLADGSIVTLVSGEQQFHVITAEGA